MFGNDQPPSMQTKDLMRIFTYWSGGQLFVAFQDMRFVKHCTRCDAGCRKGVQDASC
jgi:hypothetical protein